MKKNRILELESLIVWLSLLEQIRPTSAFAKITQLNAGRADARKENCFVTSPTRCSSHCTTVLQSGGEQLLCLRLGSPNEDIRDLEAESFPRNAIFSVIPHLA